MTPSRNNLYGKVLYQDKEKGYGFVSSEAHEEKDFFFTKEDIEEI